MLYLEFLGEPKALKRHRMGKGFSYDPSKADKEVFAIVLRKNAPKEPINVPIKVEIWFEFPRPKSHFGTGKNANTLKSNAPYHHVSKPDIDNLQKFVMDALNGIYWRDDSLISIVHATKRYADTQPKTIIRIEEC